VKNFLLMILSVLILSGSSVFADDISDTRKIFLDAGESAGYFKNCYGYAIFPTIGKAGIGLGGAFGKGPVYEQNKKVGEARMSQVSIGFQLGAQGYSQIIFFQDKRAFDEFISGNFEFGVTAEAVAITAGVSAGAGTTGNSATASGGKNNAVTSSDGYHKGMMVFTIAKGGLMYEASIGGQKFKYTAK